MPFLSRKDSYPFIRSTAWIDKLLGPAKSTPTPTPTPTRPATPNPHSPQQQRLPPSGLPYIDLSLANQDNWPKTGLTPTSSMFARDFPQEYEAVKKGMERMGRRESVMTNRTGFGTLYYPQAATHEQVMAEAEWMKSQFWTTKTVSARSDARTERVARSVASAVNRSEGRRFFSSRASRHF